MLKTPEHLGLLVLRDATPCVAHLEIQTPVCGVDAQQHLPLRREFDRIAQEVAQHLQQALSVGAHPPRQAGVQVASPRQAFGARTFCVHRQSFVHQGLQVKVLQVQHQLARLQL